MRFRQIFLTSSVSLLLFTTAFGQSNKWVSAYYGGWQSSHLPPDSIDFAAFTHLIHFNVYPSGGASFDGTLNGMTAGHMNATVNAAHRAGKKVILSVCGDFREAVSPANRAQSVQNLLSYLQTYGYDGIDIDWEPITDPSNFAPWIRALQTALKAANPNYLLTDAAFAFDQAVVDNASLFDQVNLMTYDMAGPWPGWVSWHNSPIYDGGFRFPSTGGLITSANGSVDQYIAAGVPREKLGIGIDFLGYYWTGGDGTPTGGVTAPRQSYTQAPVVRGNVQYYEIMDSYEGYPMIWDSAAQAAYISIDKPGSSNDMFISLDNEQTMYAKAAYVRSKGIGGVIVYELGSGYRPNQPPGQKDLLLQAVKKGFILGQPYVPDLTRPTVTLTSPLAGSTVSGTATLSANASDNSGVVFVQFALDGTAYRAPMKTGPFSIQVNTWKLSNGQHRITAIARDRSGNSDSSSVLVTVNNQGTPPLVTPLIVFDESIRAPFTNASWSAKTYANNTDVVRSGSYCVRADYVDWGALDFHSGPANNAVPIDPMVYDTLQFDVYPLSSFELTIAFYNGTTVKQQLSGNSWNHVVIPLPFLDTFDRFYFQRNLSGAATAFFDNIMFTGYGGAPPPPPRTPDGAKPQIALLAPMPPATLRDLASIAVSAVDNIGVAGVQFRVDGTDYGREDIFPPYEISVNTWYLKNGPHLFSAVARDGSGNRDSVSTQVTVANSGTPPNFDLIVFDDNLQAPFQNDSWGATVSIHSDTVRSGSHSAKVEFTGWGAWDILAGTWGSLVPISPADFDSIAFDVYPTSAFSLDIGFYNSYGPSFALTPFRWNHIAAPLAFDTSITRFFFRRNTGGTATAYFDNVRFVARAVDKSSGTTPSRNPVDYNLEQNFPNPFNPSTVIVFSLPRPTQTRLKVFDLLGREVATIADGLFQAGTFRFTFDASSPRHLSSGMYLYRLEAGDYVQTLRMLLVR